MQNIRHHGSLTLGLSLILLLSLPASSQAAPSEADWQAYNQAAIQQQIRPGYKALLAALQQTSNQLAAHCQQPQDLQEVRQSYQQAMNHWQAIQHVQFGPVTLLNRNYGLQYWPDKRNTGESQLRTALLDHDTFDASFFRTASVSLKGFPALERLLFSEQSSEKLVKGSKECNLALGISQYMSQTLEAVSSEWESQQQRMLTPGQNPYFDTAAEAAVPLMKSLVDPIQLLIDYKLDYPLGNAPGRARWSRSESWRSGQSIANLRTNLTALQQLYSGLQPVSVRSLLLAENEQPLADSIDQRFAALQQALAALPEPQGQNLPDSTEQTLREQIPALQALQQDLQRAMTALNIHLGFNSRDGD